MGIFFEILGVLFLSIEAIGIRQFTRSYNFLSKLSKWSKRSFIRMLVLNIPPFIFIIIGYVFKRELLIGLMIPIFILNGIISFLLDHPDIYEKWILIKTNEGKIGPFGFLLILLGYVMQLVSIVWQMSLNQ